MSLHRRLLGCQNRRQKSCMLLAISFRRMLGRGAARPPSTVYSLGSHHRFRLCLIVMIAVFIAIAASAAMIVPSCEISARGLRARIRSACPRSALASGRTPWETRKKQCSPWSLLTAGGGRSSHGNLGPPRKRHGCAGPPKARAAPPESGRKGDASGGSPGPSASSDRLAGRGSPAQQLSQHEPWREVGREPGNLKAPHRAPRARPRLSRCANLARPAVQAAATGGTTGAGHWRCRRWSSGPRPSAWSYT